MRATWVAVDVLADVLAALAGWVAAEGALEGGRVSAEGAVGGAGRVVAAGAARDAAGATTSQVHLALEESLQLVDARVLVVVDPAHAVEVAHGAHVLG